MVKVVVDDRRGLVQETGTGDIKSNGPSLQLDNSKPSGSLGNLAVKVLMEEIVPTGANTYFDLAGTVPSGSLVLGGKIQVVSGSGEAGPPNVTKVGYAGDTDAWSKANLALPGTITHEAAFHWPNGNLTLQTADRTPRITTSAAMHGGKFRVMISYINGMG